MKPGYKTTEFWLTLISIIVPILQAFGIKVVASPHLAQELAFVCTVAYTAQRAFLKHGFLKLLAANTTTIIHKFVGEVETPATAVHVDPASGQTPAAVVAAAVAATPVVPEVVPPAPAPVAEVAPVVQPAQADPLAVGTPLPIVPPSV
jgi:hypothetical protein